jgi:hypothetical protein
MKFQRKEHLIYYMLTNNNVRLSHYDYSFLTSMQILIHEEKDITQNQANLFTRLITKYQHQLLSKGLEQKLLHQLLWQSNIVPSLLEYTNARVTYIKEENLLTFKVPFKKDFINAFRQHGHDIWEWNRDKRRYEASPSTLALKILYTTLPNYFETVYYGEVKELIDELEKISNTTTLWNPTLVESNGEYTIAASNDTLDNILKDIPLNAEPKTLCILAELGIAIDEHIIADDQKLKFCSEYITQVDIDQIPEVAKWIAELGCKKVILTRGWGHELDKPHTLEIIQHLKNNNINFINRPMQPLELEPEEIKDAMLLQYSTLQEKGSSNRGALKNIQIINRRPISVT